MLDVVPPKPTKLKIGNKRQRAPRIRVPNNERAIFSIEDAKFVGVIQRLSLTGGSAVLAKGPIHPGQMGEMILGTVYGKVTAQIEFLHTGADGIPLAQAFRFIAMDDGSSKRYAAAAKDMERHGYSDGPVQPLVSPAPGANALSQLLHSVRRLAATISLR
jgi:hypothetical protein